MKFISALYGHLGASSTHPCVWCEGPKESFKSGANSKLRTISSVTQCVNQYALNCQSLNSAKNETALRRTSMSMIRKPLLGIPIVNIVPPSLHIVQGLLQKIIVSMEKENADLIQQLEEVYCSLGADKSTWRQAFTGKAELL